MYKAHLLVILVILVILEHKTGVVSAYLINNN